MTDIIIDVDFLKNHKCGTVCGQIGNVCFSDPVVIDLLDKFVATITLVEHDFDTVEEFKTDDIYSLSSAEIVFNPNVALTGNLRTQLAEYYSDYYDGDTIDEAFDHDMDIVGEIIMMKIGDAGGSWRYDGYDVMSGNLTSFFESE